MFNFFYNSFIIILLYNNLSSKKYLHLGKKIPNDAAIIAKMSILAWVGIGQWRFWTRLKPFAQMLLFFKDPESFRGPFKNLRKSVTSVQSEEHLW
jgi:hypothetical protein